MPIVTVVVVDDHDLLRAGVHDLLVSMPDYRLVGEARTAREGLEVIAEKKPDVVLMDIAMPGMDGVVATREIIRRSPEARVVILSAHKDVYDVMDALHAGAVGYVLKADPPEMLMHALERAARGATFFSPVVALTLAAAEAHGWRGNVLEVLSEREREIFRLAADCRTSLEIARELCLARKTVDAHLHQIHKKLNLRDRAALVRLAVSIGLVHSLRNVVSPRARSRFSPANTN